MNIGSAVPSMTVNILNRVCVLIPEVNTLRAFNNYVGFWFKQTGSYLLKDGHEYKVARQFQHSQARKAELNYTPDK